MVGREQGGVLPVLVVQNDVGNKYSPNVTVATITSPIEKACLPTHLETTTHETGLERILLFCEQVCTTNKQRLTHKIAHLEKEAMDRVNTALEISVGLLSF